MEKINKIIQLFAGLDTEERKAAARDVRLADLLLDKLDQHGEIPVFSIRKISSSNKNINPVQVLFQNNGEILNPYRRIDDVIKEALLIHNTPKSEIGKKAGLNKNYFHVRVMN